MLRSGPSTEFTEDELKKFAEIDQLEAKRDNNAPASYEPYKDYFPRYNHYKAKNAKEREAGMMLNQENVSAAAPRITPPPAGLLAVDAPLTASRPLSTIPLNREMIAAARERELKRKEDAENLAKDKRKSKSGCCRIM